MEPRVELKFLDDWEKQNKTGIVVKRGDVVWGLPPRSPRTQDWLGNWGLKAPQGSLAPSGGGPGARRGQRRAPGPPPAVTAASPRSPPLRRRQLTHSRPRSPSPPRRSRPARCRRSWTPGGLASCWRRGDGRRGGRGRVNSGGASPRSAARAALTLSRLPLRLRLKLSHPFPTLRPFPGRWRGRGRAGGGGGAAAPGQQPPLGQSGSSPR